MAAKIPAEEEIARRQFRPAVDYTVHRPDADRGASKKTSFPACAAEIFRRGVRCAGAAHRLPQQYADRTVLGLL
jgi:hypothetical protein